MKKSAFEEAITIGATITEIQKLTKKGREEVLKRIDTYKSNGWNIKVEDDFVSIETDLGKETFTMNADGTSIAEKIVRATPEQIRDKSFLLKVHGFDENQYEIIKASSNIWNSYSKQDGRFDMYSSRLTVQPNKQVLTQVDIKEHYETYKPKLINISKNIGYSSKGKMSELNIADLHLGKLAWFGECRENYDYKIAKARFEHILADNIKFLSQQKQREIRFIWSNDFFHFDTPSQTTTAGTPQDSDLRQKKMSLIGKEMLVDAITNLREIAPVKTIWTPSNHDNMISYETNLYLDAWFKNDKSVTINTECYDRQYDPFGATLIGYAHGDGIKAEKLMSLMPIEAKEHWSECKYYEFHVGHLHSEKLKENNDNGIIVRYVASPTGSDKWHSKNGYIGAVKKSQTFVYDYDLGLTDTHYTPIPYAM